MPKLISQNYAKFEVNKLSKVLTLGELLLRYSTIKGEQLSHAAALNLHYGGSEANVAIGLSGFGHDVTLVSKIPDNSFGQGSLYQLKRYGVNTNQVHFGEGRMGSYFVEIGAGPRATSVVYDRKSSTFSLLETNEWDYNRLFEDVSLFHVSGITPALSPFLAQLTIDFVKEAKKRGVLVSFDSNYRGKLWGLPEAAKVFAQILPDVDYCSMGALDAVNILGIEAANRELSEEEALAYYYQKMQEKYPNIEVFYSTRREVVSSDENYLTGTLWLNETYYTSKKYHIPYIVDRIGGGDAFSAGVLHGLLEGKDAQEIIDFATGNTVLKHTVAGDALSLTEKEVELFVQSDSSKINR